MPGKPEESLLVEAINYEGPEMPPAGKLVPEKVAVLTRWVKISLHVAFAALTATSLSLLGSWVGYALTAMVPLVDATTARRIPCMIHASSTFFVPSTRRGPL